MAVTSAGPVPRRKRPTTGARQQEATHHTPNTVHRSIGALLKGSKLSTSLWRTVGKVWKTPHLRPQGTMRTEVRDAGQLEGAGAGSRPNARATTARSPCTAVRCRYGARPRMPPSSSPPPAGRGRRGSWPAAPHPGRGPDPASSRCRARCARARAKCPQPPSPRTHGHRCRRWPRGHRRRGCTGPRPAPPCRPWAAGWHRARTPRGSGSLRRARPTRTAAWARRSSPCPRSVQGRHRAPCRPP